MSQDNQTPKARKTRLLVEELDGETLVYDLETHEAHCLNPTATFVWKHADGEMTVRELTALLPTVGIPEDEGLVWFAIKHLANAGLLDEPIPAPEEPARFTRKEVLRVLGAAAGMTLLLPAVDSVVAPLAAQAASCITSAQCNARVPVVEGGAGCDFAPNVICANRRKCCLEVRRGRSVTCSPNQFC